METREEAERCIAELHGKHEDEAHGGKTLVCARVLSLFLFILLFLLFCLFFQFHWLSAAVHIANTACGAAIVFALTYHFKFKSAFLTNKSLTIPQFTAIH